MSDFDAEAERKRLREKYESEEEDRKRTQQMSELLLKGATMTNRHCGECGSPIFQYDGQEFCPSCQRTMDGNAGGERADPGAEESADGDTTGAGGAGSEPKAPTADAETGGEPPTPRRGDKETTQERTDLAAANGVGTADGAAGVERDRNTEPAAPGGSGPEVGADATTEPAPRDDAAMPTRQAARESLLTALTRHARLAADTDEPRQATDHLEAARTAATALDELDRS